jgi:hypothetical protein
VHLRLAGVFTAEEMMEARPGADKENNSHDINGNTSSRVRSSRNPKHAQSPGSTSSESEAAAWDGDVRLVTISARRLLEWSVGHPPVAVVKVYEKYSGGSWNYVCSTVC